MVLVIIPLGGLFHLRRIGTPHGKLQFSLGALLGTVTACMVVFSAATTIIQLSGLRGAVHVVLLLEMVFFFVGAVCFLLLLWRDWRWRKATQEPLNPLSYHPQEGED